MPSLCDYAQTRQFFSLLKTRQTYPFDLLPIRTPVQSSDSGRKSRQKATVEEWQSEGRGVYAVINDSGDTDSEITQCAPLLRMGRSPKDWQVDAWRDLYSLNLLSKSIPAASQFITIGSSQNPPDDDWKSIKPACDHADACSLRPSRVMRLQRLSHRRGRQSRRPDNHHPHIRQVLRSRH